MTNKLRIINFAFLLILCIFIPSAPLLAQANPEGEDVLSASTLNSAFKDVSLWVEQPSKRRVASHWCTFKLEPGTPGRWDKYEGEPLEGKNIAVVVHGHSTSTLINEFMQFIFGEAISEHLGFQNKHEMGLKELVHLGRYLRRDARMPDDPNKPRFDLVLGFAYSSAHRLETLGNHFANEVIRLLGPCKSVVFIAHSMGGLVTRWGLEVRGLATRYPYLITLASPHQGIALPLRSSLHNFIPANALSTIDMITASPKLNEEKESGFLKTLNQSISHYAQIAHYFTLIGDRYDDLTMEAPPGNEPVKPSKGNIGYIIQNAITTAGILKGWGLIQTDGLVPTYSAGSEYIKQKSMSYALNPLFKRTLPLNHRTITGSIDGYLDPYIMNPNSPQAMVTNVLNEWLNTIPVETH